MSDVIENNHLCIFSDDNLTSQATIERYNVLPGDILVSMHGDRILSCAFVERVECTAVIQSGIARIRIDKEKLDSERVFEYLCSNDGKKVLEKVAGSLSHNWVNNAALAEMEIPIGG